MRNVCPKHKGSPAAAGRAQGPKGAEGLCGYRWGGDGRDGHVLKGNPKKNLISLVQQGTEGRGAPGSAHGTAKGEWNRRGV